MAYCLPFTIVFGNQAKARIAKIRQRGREKGPTILPSWHSLAIEASRMEGCDKQVASY